MKKVIGSILIMAMLISSISAFAAQPTGSALLWSESFDNVAEDGTVAGWTIPAGTTVSSVNGLDGKKAVLINTASSSASFDYDIGAKDYINIGEESDAVGKKIILSYDVMAYAKNADGSLVSGTWFGAGKNYDFRIDLLDTDSLNFSKGTRTRTYNGTMNGALNQNTSYGPDVWTMPDGITKCGMYLNQWYRMQSVIEVKSYDAGSKMYTMEATYYIDGNKLMSYTVDNNQLTATGEPLKDTDKARNCKIRYIRLTTKTNNNTLAFDNMSISEYDESYIAKNWNFKDKNTTTDVFESFDSYDTGKTSSILSLNDSKTVQIKSNPADKSLLLPKLSSGTNNLTKNFNSFSLQKDKIYVLGFDMMFDAVDTDAKPLFAPIIKYDTNCYMDLFRYNPATGWHNMRFGDGVVIPSNSKLDSKSWYKFNCLFDFENEQITYFVNGEPLKDSDGNTIIQPFTNACRTENSSAFGIDSKLASVMIQYRSGNANFYIDNVRFEPYDNIIGINGNGIAAIKEFKTVSEDSDVTALPSENSQVNVEVQAINELGSDLPISVIAASYKSSGESAQLVDTQLESNNLKDGFEGSVGSVTIERTSDVDKINAFVWSDTSKMTPYAAAISLK